MGGEPYIYVVDYDDDVQAALDRLRDREFLAGRYSPVMMSPSDVMPIGPDSPAPGAGHDSIDDALLETEGAGTRSILDLFEISDAPEPFTATRLTDPELVAFFGTTEPSIDLDRSALDELLGWLDRGHGACATLYRDGRPAGLLFVGVSFD